MCLLTLSRRVIQQSCEAYEHDKLLSILTSLCRKPSVLQVDSAGFLLLMLGRVAPLLLGTAFGY